MGRLYTAIFSGVAVTAAQDFFEILAPTDAVVALHEFEILQTSDVKDVEEEILRIDLVRGVGAVTSGSGGTTSTAQPIHDGDAAFGGTVEANNTTRMAAGSGSIENLGHVGWNVRGPGQKIYTPETRPTISPGNRLTISIASAPADSLTVSGSVTFEEIGG